jgi:hypothetical protein
MIVPRTIIVVLMPSAEAAIFPEKSPAWGWEIRSAAGHPYPFTDQI